MSFPSTLEATQLAAVGLHLLVTVVLGLSMYAWRDVHKTGSRAGFAACCGFVNLALLYEWSTRLRDAETELRTDGVEVFPAMPIVSAIVMALSSIALTLFTRFKCPTVGWSITYWSSLGSIVLAIALRAHHLDVALYAWILGVFFYALTGLQAVAWSVVPDTINPRGTKEQRRTGPFAWILVAVYAIFMIGTAGLILVGNGMLDAIDSDSALYAWLNIGTRSLTLPVIFPIVGLLFYWNDIKLDDDKAQ
jgi:hypothetical protein